MNKIKKVLNFRIFIVFAALGFFVFLTVISGDLIRAYTTGSYTKDTYVRYATPGETNILIGYITLQDPVADTVVTNGSTAVVTAGDSLTAFPSTHKFFDPAGDGAYADNDGIISSSDTVLDSGDTIITTAVGLLETFNTSFTETGANTAIGWIDNTTDDNILTSDEDLVHILVNTAQVADGLLVREFETDIVYAADAYGDTYNITNDNAIVEDSDADGFFSAGDAVLIAGPGNVRTFGAGDNVCFDASVSADAEYDSGEIIWLDVAGDCSSFTTSTDSILIGSSAPSGTSTEFGTENEVGYLDGSDDDAYTCTRTGDCETIVYSGVNGTDLTIGGNLTTNTAFFDSSSEATDGISTTGDAWDGGINITTTNRFFYSETTGGEKKFVYIDADTNTDFTSTDPILQIIDKGADNIVSGQDFRSFKDNDYRLIDRDDDDIYSSGSDGIIASDDNDLESSDTVIYDEVSGAGTDSLVAFSSTHRFHDHDSSGSYADEDDIINDSDSSTYYNADDLLSIGFKDNGGGPAPQDADIDAFYVYEMTGTACAGSGTDTLLGSVTGTVLDQNIAITRAPWTASDSVNLCIYMDAASGLTAGRKLSLSTGTTNPMTFSSGVDSSMNVRAGDDNQTIFMDGITPNISPSDLNPSETATYTISYTTSVTHASGLNILNTFPSGYDVSGGTASCTDDGATISGTSTIIGQLLGVAGTGAEITSGSAIVCTLSGVVNPSAEEETGAFLIGIGSNLTPDEGDDSQTVTIATSSSSQTPSNPPPTWHVSVESPNGGEIYQQSDTIEIKWVYSGTGSSDYINIYYSEDSGESWNIIAKNTENDGLYNWESLNINSSDITVKVATTDLVEDLAFDISDNKFTIGDFSDEVNNLLDDSEDLDEGELEVCGGSSLPSDINIGDNIVGINADGVQYPSVFYIGNDCKRHPYLTEKHYFSYGYDDFSNIEVYTTTILEQISEGKTMPVKSGSILIKTPDDPIVYYVKDTGDLLNPELYSIPTESDAIEYFGNDWAQRIIDVQTPFLTLFEMNGKDISQLVSSEVSVMYTSSELRAK